MHEIKQQDKITVGVITISDTRNKETDKGGSLIQEMLKEHNINVLEEHYTIVKDDQRSIVEAVQMLLVNVDAVITTGGTGIAPRDVTVEALRPLFDKELEGFGELFRMLSYTKDVGSKGMLSRAVAGTVDRKIVFALPGSTGAVRLAMRDLILPELNHVVSELKK